MEKVLATANGRQEKEQDAAAPWGTTQLLTTGRHQQGPLHLTVRPVVMESEDKRSRIPDP